MCDTSYISYSKQSTTFIHKMSCIETSSLKIYWSAPRPMSSRFAILVSHDILVESRNGTIFTHRVIRAPMERPKKRMGHQVQSLPTMSQPDGTGRLSYYWCQKISPMAKRSISGLLAVSWVSLWMDSLSFQETPKSTSSSSSKRFWVHCRTSCKTNSTETRGIRG